MNIYRHSQHLEPKLGILLGALLKRKKREVIIETKLDNRKMLRAKMRTPSLKINLKPKLSLSNLNLIGIKSHTMNLVDNMKQRNKVTVN